MKDNYEGISLYSQVGNADQGSSTSYTARAIIGSNFAEDRGNAVVTVEFSKSSGHLNNERDWERRDFRLVTNPDNAGDPNENSANGIPDRRGYGLFARAGIGDDETLPIDWHLSVGLGGRGPIPGRPDDHYGLGYFYNHAQDSRLTSVDGIKDHSQGFEAFYNAAMTSAARLTLSVQVGDDVDEETDTAVVVGARFQLLF